MMEPRQQLEAWSKQAAGAGKEAKADFDVALRLLKHGTEALDEIERLKAAVARVETVMAEFEGMTGSGYRYMAAHIRDAIKAPNKQKSGAA